MTVVKRSPHPEPPRSGESKDGCPGSTSSPLYKLTTLQAHHSTRYFAAAYHEGNLSEVQLLKKVIPLVINDNKCGEILDLDFPDRFHAKLGIFQHFNMLDAVLR